MATLYEDLGGTATIAGVVDRFYARVLDNPTLSPLFAGVDLAKLRRHQAAFLVSALGGPNEYRGRGLRRAHTGLGITEEQFGAVAGHLVDELTASGVPAPTVEAVIGQVAQLYNDVVGL